jgi:hypothetical protein
MKIQAGPLLFAALVLGLAHADAYAAADPSLTIEVDQSTRLLPERVVYHRTANGIEVSGRVAKRSDYRGRILGHVHITLLDAQGFTLAEHQAALTGFSPSQKNPDWASFSTRIEPLPAGVQGLRIRHRVGD